MDQLADWELVRRYVERGSQEAFAELTRRYLGIVYGFAVRELGDRTAAEDVAQAVFLILARKAHTLRPNIVLASWLFNTTKFAAGHARRSDLRRQVREEKAAMAMQQQREASEQHTSLAESQIGDALRALSEPDRQAVLLRHVCGCSFAETGAACGVSEEAARKRVDRAVEKLRRILTGGGAALSAVALADVLHAQAAQALPPGLETKVAGIILAHGTAAAGATAGVSAVAIAQGALKSMSIVQLKLIAAAVVCGVVVTAGGAAAYRSGLLPGGGATFRGNTPVMVVPAVPAVTSQLSATTGAGPNGTSIRTEAVEQIQLSLTYAFVDAADLERLSKQVPSGRDHDAILLDLLRKSGARVNAMPILTTTNNVQAQITLTTQVAYDTVVDGMHQTNFLKLPTSTSMLPRINGDRSIMLEMRHSTGTVTPGASPPVTWTFAFQGTIPDGQTTLIIKSAPEKSGLKEFILYFVTATINPAKPAPEPASKLAADFEARGWMSSADYLRLDAIQHVSAPTGKLTDDEYDFLFALLKKPSTSPSTVTSSVFGVFLKLPAIAPERREQLYEAALVYLTAPPSSPLSDVSCLDFASGVMVKLGDKRAIPYIVPLLNHSVQIMRDDAARDLRKLGYVAPAGASTPGVR